jgi:hypothetical protein
MTMMALPLQHGAPCIALRREGAAFRGPTEHQWRGAKVMA